MGKEDKLYADLGIRELSESCTEKRMYEVPFTLFVEAESPHEAFQRALQFRNMIANAEGGEVRKLPFYFC